MSLIDRITGKNVKDVKSIEFINKIINIKYDKYEDFFYGNCFFCEDAEKKYLFLQELYRNGGAIWFTAKGNINYRLYKNGNIYVATKKKTKQVLSRFLQKDIKIEENSNKGKDYIIDLNDFVLIDGEIFEPYVYKEFFTYDPYKERSYNSVCKSPRYFRNLFIPSEYLLQKIQLKREYLGFQETTEFNYKASNLLILQYIFYLANYEEKKFKFILYWLGSFFKNLKQKSSKALILIGENSLVKDIFFNNIITPLFGCENTIKIDSRILETKNMLVVAKNKLFYYYDKISDENIKDNKTKQILKGIIEESELDFTDDKNLIKTSKIYGQTLISTNEEMLNIDIKNNAYIVIKVPSSLDELYIPEYLNIQHKNKEYIEAKIKEELEDFAYLLKIIDYNLDYFKNCIISESEDDRSLLVQNTKDQVVELINATLEINEEYFFSIKENHEELYNDIKKDFASRKIKQKNLLECFRIKYDKKDMPSKSIMKAIRDVNQNKFSVKNIKSGSNNSKYYEI